MNTLSDSYFVLFSDCRLVEVEITSGVVLTETQVEIENVCWMFYMEDSDGVLVCSKNGVLRSVVDAQVNEIYDFQNEIAAVDVSYSYIAILTRDGVLSMMSNYYDIITQKKIFEDCNGDTTLKWNPNGSVLIVNVENPERKIYGYDAECEVKFVGRNENKLPISKLKNCVAYNEALIASVQKTGNKTKVVFFEAGNGLRHREFVIQSKKDEVVNVLWNGDSSLLAVVFMDEIQLYTRSNYVWYLKQQIRLDGRISNVKFDMESNNTIRGILENGVFFQYTLEFYNPTNGWLNGVVNGPLLLVSKFDTALIPPPMALDTIEFEDCIVDVCFVQSNCIAALLSDCTISIRYQQPLKKVSIQLLEMDYRQIIGLSENEFAVLGQNSNGVDCIAIVKNEKVQILELSDSVIRLFPHVDRSYGNIEYGSGHVEQFSTDTSPEWVFKADKPTFHIQMVPNARMFLSKAKSQLSVNNFVLSSNCGSVLMNDHYLFYVHLEQTNKLLGIELSSLETIDLQDSKLNNWSRMVERGARLVFVSSVKPLVVLQMPRGNLEGIYPHPLVCNQIKLLLDTQLYYDALETCRRQRVDMNILIRYHSDQYDFQNVALEFVKQIPVPIRCNRLNLFVSNIHDIVQEGEEVVHLPVSTVCDVLIETIDSLIDDDSLITTQLTCDVRRPKPLLCEALRRVQAIKDTNVVEKSLNYLLLLVDVDKLYDAALSLYDIDLTFLVLKHSQKDPAEYYPLLRDLQSEPEHIRRYRIDIKRENYESALKNIRLSMEELHIVDSPVVYDLLSKPGIPTIAVQVFNVDEYPKLHRDILKAQGDEFNTKKEYDAAAISFLSAIPPFFGEAIVAFRQAGNWRMALALAQKSTLYTSEETTALAHSIATDFKSNTGIFNKPLEAAAILSEHCNDIDEAMSVLLLSKCWESALNLAVSHHRSDLIANELSPAAVYACGSMLESMELQMEEFAKCIDRIESLEKQRSMFLSHGLGGVDADVEGDTSSMYSYASSVASAMSMDSNVSLGSHNLSTNAKHRVGNFSLLSIQETSHTAAMVAEQRRTPNVHKKKTRMNRNARRGKIRKGSKEELVYLQNFITTLIPNDAYHSEVHQLCRILLYLDEPKLSIQLSARFQKLINRTDPKTFQSPK